MSEKKIVKPVAMAVGAALAGSFALAGTVNADTADSPFAMSSLEAGYMLGAEGSCGGDKEDKGKEGSCGEGSCGGSKEDKKGGEGSCGEGSCGGSKDDGKGKEGSCGGDKEDKKGGEGSCGEGSCGGSV